jgi:hypothetical protein
MQFPGERVWGMRGTLRRMLEWISLVPSKPRLSDWVNWYPTVFANTDTLTYVDNGTDTTPSMVVTDDTPNILVVATGMVGYDKVPRCLQYWGDNNNNTNECFVPPYGFSIVDFRPLMVGARGTVGFRNAIFVGHSYGGAIASDLCGAGGVAFDRNTQRYLYSFGAPKTVVGVSSGNFQGVIARRVYTRNDPVPALPFPGNNFGRLLPYFSNYRLLQMQRYYHPVTGMMFADDNTLQIRMSSDREVLPNWVGPLANWLTGVSAFGSADHSLSAYQTAVTAMADDTPLPLATPVPGDPPPRVRTPPADIPGVLQAAVAGQASIVSADPATAASQIARATPLVPGIKWNGRKNRGHRALYYGDDFIVWLHSRRQQLKLVRKLNQMAALPANAGTLLPGT